MDNVLFIKIYPKKQLRKPLVWFICLSTQRPLYRTILPQVAQYFTSVAGFGRTLLVFPLHLAAPRIERVIDKTSQSVSL